MKLFSTLAAAGFASVASAEIVTVEFDLAGLVINGPGVYAQVTEELSHYENATILDFYWSDLEVSIVDIEGDIDSNGQEAPGSLTVLWLADLPQIGGLNWWSVGATVSGATGDYTIDAGRFDLAGYISDIGAAATYPGYNYGAGAVGTAGSTILSGTVGFTVDVVPAPGALALIGLAGLGRRRRA